MSFAPALVLREGVRDRLAELARLPGVPSGLAKRARMVLASVREAECRDRAADRVARPGNVRVAAGLAAMPPVIAVGDPLGEPTGVAVAGSGSQAAVQFRKNCW